MLALMIKLFIQDTIYFQVFWKDIEKIEFINQKYTRVIPKVRATYLCPKLIFTTLTISKKLNLIGLPFKWKMNTIIISSIKHIAIMFNKEFIQTPILKS